MKSSEYDIISSNLNEYESKHERLLIAVAVACVASSTLSFELVQTRVLSALYYNHVVYFTVTVALMGFGISGVVVSIFSRKIVDSRRLISSLSAAYVASLALCIAIVSHLPEAIPFAPTALKLTFSYLVLMTPFLLSGSVLGLIFMRYADRIFRLYAIDLIASAAFAVGFMYLLQPLGAEGFVWLCIAVAAIGFLATARWLGLGAFLRVGLPCFLAPVLILAAFGELVGVQPEPYKTLGSTYFQSPPISRKIEATEWTPIAKIDLISDTARNAVSGLETENADQMKLILQDGSAFTPLFGPKEVKHVLNLAKAGEARDSQSLTYLMRETTSDALVIGVGGGNDILEARAYGAENIIGVEINGATIELVTNREAAYLVWPAWSDIDVVRAEGRHYVRQNPNKFDTIVMSGIDTFTALSSGAYVLTENYLYTVEAFEDYLNSLKDDGVLSIFRWLFPQPRESLRLVSLYLEAATRSGIDNPERSVIVVSHDQDWGTEFTWASTFVRKGPFLEKEVDIILGQVASKAYLDIVYLPREFHDRAKKLFGIDLAPKQEHFLRNARFAYLSLFDAYRNGTLSEFYDSYEFKLEPVFDNGPFFFEYDKAGGIAEVFRSGFSEIRSGAAKTNLYLLFGLCFLLSLFALVVPLMIFHRDGLKTEGAARLFVFFGSLGLGFMMIEIGLMQRLSLYLGDPMRSLVVVLAGLLTFTGLGSYLAGSSRLNIRQLLSFGMIGVPIVTGAWISLAPFVLPATEGLPFEMRALLVLATLVPFGLTMGIPFATGLHFVGSQSPRFIPWAWGVNGITSVMASIIAIVLAMQFGFTIVIILGSLLYLIGWIAILTLLKTGAHVAP